MIIEKNSNMEILQALKKFEFSWSQFNLWNRFSILLYKHLN